MKAEPQETVDIAEKTEATACVVCQKSFIDTRRMQAHLIRKHTVRTDHNSSKEYICKKCDKTYSTQANLTIHERTHTGN